MGNVSIRAWWDRLHGRGEPRPCSLRAASALELSGRRLVAGPRRVLDFFGIQPGERVLEIGPGTGFYSLEAARRVGPAGQLICVDIQPSMLHETRGHLMHAGLTAAVVCGNGCLLPLRAESIDHVFMISVLGELANRRAALEEIRRVLRPGGHLSISEQLPDPDFVTPGRLRLELRAAGFVEERTHGWLIHTSTWHRLNFSTLYSDR